MTRRSFSECALCGSRQTPVSRGVGVCVGCLRERPEPALAIALGRHRAHREAQGLAPSPPRDPGGIRCAFCTHGCRIGPGRTGFCGLRRNVGGRLVGGVRRGNFSWYPDPLPTNCVADWVCPGGTGAGFPQYAHRPGPEHGYRNLAVFSQVCCFDCAFCQNGSYRRLTLSPTWHTAEDLAGAVTPATACICFFGGDPAPQMPLFLRAARLARRGRGRAVLRICWETNGSSHPALLDAALGLSLESGGCVKFDLKAWTPAVHKALTGADNRRTLENFARAAARIPERPEPPPVVASTLLVPGYVDPPEVGAIASFISGLDPTIPYALLAFAPHLFMADLPTTSRAHALACLEAARAAGLTRVRLGNEHLLGPPYPVGA